MSLGLDQFLWAIDATDAHARAEAAAVTRAMGGRA